MEEPDRDRHLDLEGARNTRDIGGYQTADGRTVAWDKVIRAAGFSDLTDADHATLEAIGVTIVVDFRGPDEIERYGPDLVPDGVEVISIPLLDESGQALTAAITTASRGNDPTVLEDLLGNGEAERIGDELFLEQLDIPTSVEGYAETLRVIADADGAVVYHCTAGKDRTGMMTAILLGILGVDDETILEDFVLSNEYNQEYNEGLYASLSERGLDVELLRPLLEQRRSMIEPVLQVVHEEYGGWDSFAQEALGVSETTLEALRTKLLV